MSMPAGIGWYLSTCKIKAGVIAVKQIIGQIGEFGVLVIIALSHFWRHTVMPFSEFEPKT